MANDAMSAITVQEVAQRVAQLVRDNFPSASPDLAGAANLKDLGLDSLDVVDLAWAIESDFQIKFSDDDLQRITSLDSSRNSSSANCAHEARCRVWHRPGVASGNEP